MVKGKKVKNSRSNELVSELCIQVCEGVKEFIITQSKVPIVRYPELDDVGDIFILKKILRINI